MRLLLLVFVLALSACARKPPVPAVVHRPVSFVPVSQPVQEARVSSEKATAEVIKSVDASNRAAALVAKIFTEGTKPESPETKQLAMEVDAARAAADSAIVSLRDTTGKLRFAETRLVELQTQVDNQTVTLNEREQDLAQVRAEKEVVEKSLKATEKELSSTRTELRWAKLKTWLWGGGIVAVVGLLFVLKVIGAGARIAG